AQYYEPGVGNVTEASTSKILGFLDETFSLSEYILRYRNSKCVVCHRSTNMGIAAPTTHLFAEISASFITLGNKLEVEVDSASTFKWRVNGGSFTTSVPIAAEVSLGSGTKLYFRATSGFTPGDAWEWLRTDCWWSDYAP